MSSGYGVGVENGHNSSVGGGGSVNTGGGTSVGLSGVGGLGNGPSLGAITLKIILSREEVQYLFGFDGTLINQLRSQSGANINLTDGDSYERVLMINGSLELIFKAFSLITRKLWDFISSLKTPQNLVIRLAVPASQCGSIIGKQGSKVKEIRDLTGANIQVSQESLGDSTERCVEISGSGEACLQCAYHVCTVLEETPLRGEIIPYVPSLLPRSRDWKPVFLCGDKAYVIDGDVAHLAPPELLRKELGKTALGPVGAENAASYNRSSTNSNDPGLNPLALMAAVNARSHSDSNALIINREMSVETEFVGSIIGKGGTKIAEIRRMSGATITVNEDEDGGPTRAVSLSGPEESVLLAQFLIQSTVDAAMRERSSSDYGLSNHPMQQQQQPPPPPSQQQQSYMDPSINYKDQLQQPYQQQQQPHHPNQLHHGHHHHQEEDPRSQSHHHHHQQQQQHSGTVLTITALIIETKEATIVIITIGE
ncbi:poly(rC)-binding protein 3 [Lepeophtheirus salmonis]|uniref:poly(rC)-binding protein 3 n=1 Tax=Lepeophtheirus salmonis TaxID=72036 RepID=UPI001AE57DE6|nr:poly(rC)-binding protein 3-like [Lepeophtheirus salmonis]